jgi:hypothetical protein
MPHIKNGTYAANKALESIACSSNSVIVIVYPNNEIKKEINIRIFVEDNLIKK